ncbi:unnamed protein product [Amoebophrya sp. A25]|nr:unnamed protein product [Amoebophrya sp. A25]|eukprot:GSA25T00003411001.1
MAVGGLGGDSQKAPQQASRASSRPPYYPDAGTDEDRCALSEVFEGLTITDCRGAKDLFHVYNPTAIVIVGCPPVVVNNILDAAKKAGMASSVNYVPEIKASPSRKGKEPEGHSSGSEDVDEQESPTKSPVPTKLAAEVLATGRSPSGTSHKGETAILAMDGAEDKEVDITMTYKNKKTQAAAVQPTSPTTGTIGSKRKGGNENEGPVTVGRNLIAAPGVKQIVQNTENNVHDNLHPGAASRKGPSKHMHGPGKNDGEVIEFYRMRDVSMQGLDVLPGAPDEDDADFRGVGNASSPSESSGRERQEEEESFSKAEKGVDHGVFNLNYNAKMTEWTHSFGTSTPYMNRNSAEFAPAPRSPETAQGNVVDPMLLKVKSPETPANVIRLQKTEKGNRDRGSSLDESASSETDDSRPVMLVDGTPGVKITVHGLQYLEQTMRSLEDCLFWLKQKIGDCAACREEVQKAAVICPTGGLQAPVVVICFLMRYRCLTLLEAFDLVYRARRSVWPTPFAMLLMIAYEKSLFRNNIKHTSTTMAQLAARRKSSEDDKSTTASRATPSTRTGGSTSPLQSSAASSPSAVRNRTESRGDRGPSFMGGRTKSSVVYDKAKLRASPADVVWSQVLPNRSQVPTIDYSDYVDYTLFSEPELDKLMQIEAETLNQLQAF